MDITGWRKISALGAIVIVAVGLVIWKGDVPSNFLMLMQWAFGIFVGGNAVEHLANGFGPNNTDATASAPVTVTADTSGVGALVNQLAQNDQTTHNALAQQAQAIAVTQQGIMHIIRACGLDKPEAVAAAQTQAPVKTG